MRRLVPPRRVLVVLGAAVLGAAVLVGGSPAYAIGVVGTQAFYADSGDSCPLGLTKGTLSWNIGPGPLGATAVDVAGYVIDRPLLTDPSTVCRDPRYTTASFVAYQAKVVVDSELVKVDNGQLAIKFQLAGPRIAAYTPIDLVVIQVCRHAPPGMGIYDYCGKAVEYRPPPTPVV